VLTEVIEALVWAAMKFASEYPGVPLIATPPAGWDPEFWQDHLRDMRKSVAIEDLSSGATTADGSPL
jgi:hypothetical protein